MRNEYLTPLVDDLRSQSVWVRENFGPLSREQLNWKPNAKKWSIAQVLDHLNTSNAGYDGIFDDLADGTYRASLWTRVSPLSGYFGSALKAAFREQASRNLGAPRVFRPRASSYEPSIVEDFVERNRRLAAQMVAMDVFPHANTLIASPVTGLVTYSVRDCCEMLVLHESHHLRHAERTMCLSEFPTR